MINLDIIIVTYNRLEKLKHTLECYEGQSAKFRNLIIVDNHSTDGTSVFLKKWSKLHSEYGKYILTMNDNLGGAGGFYEGQKFAVSLNPDWVLLADDDAYPEKKLVEEFYAFLSVNDKTLVDIAALCTSVVFPNGEICLSHRTRFRIQYGLRHFMDVVDKAEYEKEPFEVGFFSYVGAIIKVDVLRKAGFDNPDYFIYYDDSEHCIRLRKFGRIVCVPSLKIVHDSGWTENKMNEKELISWRDYYAIRNRIHMLKQHYLIPAIWFTITRIYNYLIINNEYNLECKKMIISAITDAWRNRLGKHKIYKPGWNVSK